MVLYLYRLEIFRKKENCEHERQECYNEIHQGFSSLTDAMPSKDGEWRWRRSSDNMTLLRPTPCYLVYHKSYLVERYFRGFCGLALDAHNNIQPGPGLGWLSHGARVNWSKICEHGDHT